MSNSNKECLTFYLGGQIFGIMVDHIQDVLGEYSISPVPLAREEVLGSINLRGRIVTAIDLRRVLRLSTDADPAAGETPQPVSIVVHYGDELYSLIVDRMGDVIAINDPDLEGNPPTMRDPVRSYSEGVYRLKESLLIIVNIVKLISDLEEGSAP